MHCAAGRSRSAAVVCAYLMHAEGLESEEAIADVCETHWICPNVGFKQQLQLFEDLQGDIARWPSPEDPTWPKKVTFERRPHPGKSCPCGSLDHSSCVYLPCHQQHTESISFCCSYFGMSSIRHNTPLWARLISDMISVSQIQRRSAMEIDRPSMQELRSTRRQQSAQPDQAPSAARSAPTLELPAPLLAEPVLPTSARVRSVAPRQTPSAKSALAPVLAEPVLPGEQVLLKPAAAASAQAFPAGSAPALHAAPQAHPSQKTAVEQAAAPSLAPAAKPVLAPAPEQAAHSQPAAPARKPEQASKWLAFQQRVSEQAALEKGTLAKTKVSGPLFALPYVRDLGNSSGTSMMPALMRLCSSAEVRCLDFERPLRNRLSGPVWAQKVATPAQRAVSPARTPCALRQEPRRAPSPARSASTPPQRPPTRRTRRVHPQGRHLSSTSAHFINVCLTICEHMRSYQRFKLGARGRPVI